MCRPVMASSQAVASSYSGAGLPRNLGLMQDRRGRFAALSRHEAAPTTTGGEVSGSMESLLGAVHADFQVVDQGFGQGAEDAGGAGGDLVVFHFGFAG